MRSVPRFAGRIWQGIAEAARPASKLDAAIRFGPDLVMWPALAAFSAPQGSTGLERGGIALEDATLGLGSSLLFGGLGRAAGRRMAARRGLVEGTEGFQNLLNTATTVGDLSAALPQVLAPRPFLDRTIDRLYPEQPQAQQQEQEEQFDIKTQEGLAAALLAGGGLLAGSAPRPGALDMGLPLQSWS